MSKYNLRLIEERDDGSKTYMVLGVKRDASGRYIVDNEVQDRFNQVREEVRARRKEEENGSRDND